LGKRGKVQFSGFHGMHQLLVADEIFFTARLAVENPPFGYCARPGFTVYFLGGFPTDCHFTQVIGVTKVNPGVVQGTRKQKWKDTSQWQMG
jgi:hypothetical protein